RSLQALDRGESAAVDKVNRQSDASPNGDVLLRRVHRATIAGDIYTVARPPTTLNFKFNAERHEWQGKRSDAPDTAYASVSSLLAGLPDGDLKNAVTDLNAVNNGEEASAKRAENIQLNRASRVAEPN